MKFWQALSLLLRAVGVISRVVRMSSKSRVRCRACGREWSSRGGGIIGKAGLVSIIALLASCSTYPSFSQSVVDHGGVCFVTQIL
jgi:hypothetical protein